MEPKYFESMYPDNTRFDAIERTLEILRSGRSVQLIGAPGVGKGSILRMLPYNKSLRVAHLGKEEDNFHFVYMDFSEVKKRPLSDIVKFILISLSYSLTERELTKEAETVNKFLKEALTVPDAMMLFQGLKKTIDYLANDQKLNIVLLIDRFEEYTANVDPEFFSYLRILRNRAKYRFGVVIGNMRPIEEILEPTLLGEFYEFIAGNIVYLSLFDKIGLDFRFAHLEKITKKSANKDLKEQIIKLSAGHGKIARLAYEAVLAYKPDKKLDAFLLENKQVRASLYEIWRFLTPEEKNDVKNGEEVPFLEKIELTKKGKVTIPLLADFIKTVTDDANLKLTYDSAQNTIKKGDTDLGENLSPSEFRLLRYLLINSDRVCEKDEIINNVWQDSKTREGVTDQALDQIIYRLRKKIERDPNSPQIIQTIKGRGYKLQQ